MTSDGEFFKSIGIDLDDEKSKQIDSTKVESNPSYLPRTIALASVTAGSIVVGFFGTLALAKKRDGASLDKALLPRRGMSESGTRLAFRALGWGTLYAVGGFAVVSFLIYKINIQRLQKFEERKMQNDFKFRWLPKF